MSRRCSRKEKDFTEFQEEEEEFPKKYSSPNSLSENQFRRKIFNKNSRSFAKQLKVAFGSGKKSPNLPFDLDQIYFAKSPNSFLQTPVAYSLFDFFKVSDMLRLKSCPLQNNSNMINNNEICSKVSMEKLDETQHIGSVGDCPILFTNGYWPWSFTMSLKPITTTIQLQFKGIHKFETEIDKIIECQLGGSNNHNHVTKLYVKDLPSTTFKNQLTIGQDHLQEFKQMRREILHDINFSNSTNPPKIIFDEQDHSILLIPNTNKSGFCDPFDLKEEYSFPFQVKFEIDGKMLAHSFNLPLRFQAQPQRLRLKFVFDVPCPANVDDDDDPANNWKKTKEIVVLSYFMVHSIIPSSPLPSMSASINIYEKNLTDSVDNNNYNNKGPLKLNPTQSEAETQRFVKNVLDNGANRRYWQSGKRLRYNSVPVETLSHDGYKIGFNYIYEIQPRPNREMRVENRKQIHQKRKELRRVIKNDLEDYQEKYLNICSCCTPVNCTIHELPVIKLNRSSIKY